MSQFLKENMFSPKNMTENRVLMLAEKISSLKIGHKAEAQRKIETLQKQINDLEGDLQRITVAFNDKHYDLKHIFGKIGKELSFDHSENDRSIRRQIENCQEMAIQMVSKHVEERKASDARISRFIDEKSAIIRDLIERQNKQRAIGIKEIQESLNRDLTQIKEKLESDCNSREECIQQIHSSFLEEYQKMQNEFSELTTKYSESESQFYKMLRDVLKKVKGEIGEGHREREQMQESILVLIERICDKAMEEAHLK